MRQNAKHLIDEKNAKARKAKLLAEKELDYRIEAERKQLSKLKVGIRVDHFSMKCNLIMNDNV